MCLFLSILTLQTYPPFQISMAARGQILGTLTPRKKLCVSKYRVYPPCQLRGIVYPRLIFVCSNSGSSSGGGGSSGSDSGTSDGTSNSNNNSDGIRGMSRSDSDNNSTDSGIVQQVGYVAVTLFCLPKALTCRKMIPPRQMANFFVYRPSSASPDFPPVLTTFCSCCVFARPCRAPVGCPGWCGSVDVHPLGFPQEEEGNAAELVEKARLLDERGIVSFSDSLVLRVCLRP